MADRYFSTEEEAIQDLVSRGLVVDSGQRRWCQRSRSYQIVWKCTKLGEEYDDRNMLNRKWSFWMTILRGAALSALLIIRAALSERQRYHLMIPSRAPSYSHLAARL
jgi:hypothetical protein